MGKAEKLTRLYEEWKSCQRCELSKGRNRVVFGDGYVGENAIALIGEGPGRQEDNTGDCFVGDAGKTLMELLLLVNLRADPAYKYYLASRRGAAMDWVGLRAQLNTRYFFCNVVCCRPPENRTPLLSEQKACRERLLRLLRILDPAIIITLGKTATKAITGQSKPIRKTRGELFIAHLEGHVTPIPYPVFPVFHPSYLNRVGDFNKPGGEVDKALDDLLTAHRFYDARLAVCYGAPMPLRGKDTP